jgi:4-amino-4-deoxy-L-arabinose transferase-like glycosyltransferase
VSQQSKTHASAKFHELVRRVPRAAWICALVACLNAASWSIVTPPFQVPDEPDHFAYVKQLAETGQLPASNSELLAEEEILVLVGLHNFQVRLEPQVHTIASQAEQRELRHDLVLASTATAAGSPGAGVAASEPPLYYALEAIPYSIARGATVLARLQLMRLVSALFAGITALFVFLFVREALAGAPWTWTVAGVAVALTPLLGFMSGALNPDSLLFAVSAAVFYFLAREFRRGLSTRGAVAIGVLMAVGLLTKLNFIGFVPGVLLGMVVLSVRAAKVSVRLALRLLAIAVAVGFSPVLLYAAINILSHHAPLGIASNAIDTEHRSLLAQANYIWQLYLPRLPGTVSDFPYMSTTRQLWFNGYIGLYGWLDTQFPGWLYSVSLVPAGAIALLCVRALYQARAMLPRRASELVVYATMSVGLMVLIGADSYRAFPGVDAEYGQVRYLLPLLVLLGAALALAVRGAGRRWGPVVGAAIVVLFIAHDIFSQLQVVARYYG